MTLEEYFDDVDFTPKPFTEEHINIIEINCKIHWKSYNSKNGEFSHLDSSIRKSRFKEFIKSKVKNEIVTTEDYSNLLDIITSYYSRNIIDISN